MLRLLAVAALALLPAAAAPALCQPAKQSVRSSATVDRAKLEQVMAAWATLDVSKPARFYAKDPGLVFYDVAPRKYVGWAEYASGSVEMFKTVKSLTLKLSDDAQVHVAGKTAWATATVDGEMVNKDGSSLKVDARWTSVWEQRGSDWLIVHEHFSMPLPEPTAKPAGGQ